MTSPILLGGTPVCERALGHETHQEPGGAWVASGITGRVGLYTHSITVQNPSGAWIIGIADISCYAVQVGCLIQGSTTIDGSGQTVWGIFNFNHASDHTDVRFSWWYSTGPGAHSINVGFWIAAGSLCFDTNDGGTFSCWEKA